MNPSSFQRRGPWSVVSTPAAVLFVLASYFGVYFLVCNRCVVVSTAHEDSNRIVEAARVAPSKFFSYVFLPAAYAEGLLIGHVMHVGHEESSRRRAAPQTRRQYPSGKSAEEPSRTSSSSRTTSQRAADGAKKEPPGQGPNRQPAPTKETNCCQLIGTIVMFAAM